MNREQAEILALRAMGWLAADDDLMGVFLGASGLSPDDLSQRAGDPDLLGAVLDFILMDDDWVRQFCTAEHLPFDAPARARQALPGGAEVHWT